MEGAWKLVVVVFVGLLVAGGDGAVSCSTVTTDLLPCLGYVAGSAAQPTAACCNGLKSLNAAATNTADRRSVCSCIKSASGSVGVNYAKAGKLPGLCGVNIGIPISRSVDCSTIN